MTRHRGPKTETFLFPPDQGLLTLPDFLRSFHQGQATWPLFWMALLRIQDWELKGDLLGRMERQVLFQQLTQLIKTPIPAPELMARYSPDTLILVQPLEPLPAAQPRLRSIQEEAREKLNLRLTIGAAGFPQADFAKTDILDNALKALDHALLLGPGRMAVFDDTSLNISGDKLFDQGKIAAAPE